MDQKSNEMGMIIHLVQLANYIIFPAGIIIAVILWLTKKDELPGIDVHAKNSLNIQIWMLIWIIGLIIVISVLSLITCGFGALLFFLMFIPYFYFLVMTIIAAMKAKEGEVYEVPGVLVPFLK